MTETPASTPTSSPPAVNQETPALVLAPMRDLESCPKCGRSLMCDLRPSGGCGQVECFTVYRREHRAPDGGWCGLTMWRRGDGHH